MPRLLLIRHGKAGEATTDAERPLTERGQRQAAALGRLFAETGVHPDRAVVSPATRARQTWDGISAELAEPVEVVIDERIYDNTVDALLAVIHEAADNIATLALVGHNPSFEQLAAQLSDKPEPAALADGFPTGAAVTLEVSGSWADLAPRGAVLVGLQRP